MIIEQILVTGMVVFCYLITDETTKEAVLIDPAGDYDLIFKKIEKHKANVKYIINTHGHYDHTSGNSHMLGKTGAALLIQKNDISYLRSVKSEESALFSDGEKSKDKKVFLLQDNDRIVIGNTELWVIHTPGHSAGSISIYSNGNIFTGDTLFTEGVGRTDLHDSSTESLMDSIKNKILKLPDDTKIWPGHHYGRKPVSTVAEQKKYFRISK
ncbi:MAG: MBL fold metallo-hydrolase [Spirochaetes bacterium]|nr:MBL fold metallo-hydrolase [Spirochaetota bacterium]